MFRTEKIEFGKKVLANTSSYTSVVVCKCGNITANEIRGFRQSIKRAGGLVQMGGNLIIGRALEETKFNAATRQLKGSSMMVFFDETKSAGTVAQVIQKALKTHKEKLDLTFVQLGDKVASKEAFNLLAKFPTALHAVSAVMQCLSLPMRAIAISAKEYYDLLSKEGQRS